MTTSPPAKTFASNIPGVGILREQLDQTDASLHGRSFIHLLLGFRVGYTTSNGVAGTEFNDWKSLEHQAALRQMATVFLDDLGNGQKFWPDDPSASGFSKKLQYSKHRNL